MVSINRQESSVFVLHNQENEIKIITVIMAKQWYDCYAFDNETQFSLKHLPFTLKYHLLENDS